MASPMVPASSNEERGTLVLLVQGEAGRMPAEITSLRPADEGRMTAPVASTKVVCDGLVTSEPPDVEAATA